MVAVMRKSSQVMMRLNLFFPALLLSGVVLCASPSNAFGSNIRDSEKAGALLFRDKGCAHCHGVGGAGTQKAPSLANLPKDRAWPPAKITQQILNGGQKMPPFRDSLSDEEITQLVAYLKAKNRPVPPPDTEQPAPPPAN